MVCVPVSFAMADPSSDKPDQPAASEGRKPEDAAARLNEILSSPIENPFTPGTPAASRPEPAETEAAHPPPAPKEAETALPPEFTAWEGAKATPEGAPAPAPTPPVEPGPAEAGAPPPAPAAERPIAPPHATPPEAGAARVIAKVRRLMLISTVLTALAIAAVFGVIGYRVFRSEGRLDAATQATLALPPGARIVQTAIAADRLVLTLQVGGALEIRTYDLKTLKPLGRLNFSTVP
jgi:hypothetical protein